MIPINTIICSYKLHDYCKQKYPKRNIIADMHVDHDDFYYWSKTKTMRMIRNKTEVWTLGHEWPVIIRIR